MSRRRKPAPRIEPSSQRLIARASEELRGRARQVREEVAADQEHIEAEAEQALHEALAAGKLLALRVLFHPEEQGILKAIDAYARQHGLNSRAQVVRAALQKLLKLDTAVPKKGTPTR
jgi:vacuolar-type H+-ATPase subunit E/Vma4